MVHSHEPHASGIATRLNWLRAAVLGANDGIVSISALVIGVASATGDPSTIITTGIAGILAGALSMAAGEYVSVSAQRDSERALLAKEKKELTTEPEKELEELMGIYEAKGLSRATALAVAKELTAHDAFAAHAEAELKIEPGKLINPWHAALASAAAFCAGAFIPFLAITMPPKILHIPITFVAVILSLTITGWLAASLGGAKPIRAVIRIVLGGTLAMAITYTIGGTV